MLEMIAEAGLLAGSGLVGPLPPPSGPPASTKEVFLAGGGLALVGRGRTGAFSGGGFVMDGLAMVVGTTIFLAVVVVVAAAGIGFVMVAAVVVAVAPVMALLGRLCGFVAIGAGVCFLETAFFNGCVIGGCGNFRL